LNNPVKVLRKIKTWLMPGGVLVIEVPLVNNLTEKFLGEKYLVYLDKTHRHFWTEKQLEQLTAKSGWKIVKKKSCWYEFPLTVITQGGLIGIGLWLPLKLLSIFGLNREIIRLYLRRV